MNLQQSAFAVLRGFTAYTANLTQSGQSNPEKTVFENTLETSAWTRVGQGSFVATGDFSGDIYFVKPAMRRSFENDERDADLFKQSDTEIMLQVFDAAGNLTDVFTNLSIEVRKYL